MPEGSGLVSHHEKRIMFDFRELSSSLKTPSPTHLKLNVASDCASEL